MENKNNRLNEILNGIMNEKYFDTLAQQQAAANAAYYKPISEEIEQLKQAAVRQSSENVKQAQVRQSPEIMTQMPDHQKRENAAVNRKGKLTEKVETETAKPDTARLSLSSEQMVQGVILSEILAKPVSLRPKLNRFHK